MQTMRTAAVSSGCLPLRPVEAKTWNRGAPATQFPKQRYDKQHLRRRAALSFIVSTIVQGQAPASRREEQKHRFPPRRRR